MQQLFILNVCSYNKNRGYRIVNLLGNKGNKVLSKTKIQRKSTNKTTGTTISRREMPMLFMIRPK